MKVRYRDVANLGKGKPNHWRSSKRRPRQLGLSGKQKAANFVSVELYSYINPANSHTPDNRHKTEKSNVTNDNNNYAIHNGHPAGKT